MKVTPLCKCLTKMSIIEIDTAIWPPRIKENPPALFQICLSSDLVTILEYRIDTVIQHTTVDCSHFSFHAQGTVCSQRTFGILGNFPKSLVLCLVRKQTVSRFQNWSNFVKIQINQNSHVFNHLLLDFDPEQTVFWLFFIVKSLNSS